MSLSNLGLTIIDTPLVDIPGTNPHYQGKHEYSTCFGMVRQIPRLGILPS